MQKISPEPSSTIPTKMTTDEDTINQKQPNMTSIEVEVDESELPPIPTKTILYDENAETYSCYTAFCDTVGNRQTQFIEQLRPLRTLISTCTQNLITFRFDYERDITSSATLVAKELEERALRALDEISSIILCFRKEIII